MAGRTIDPVKAERARRKLASALLRRDRARDKLEEATDKLYSECFHANQEGLTYVAIAETLGISDVRVYEILKEQRSLRA